MSAMKQRGIILSASQFNFENKDKEKVKGCSVRAIIADNLAPYKDPEKPNKGRKPAKFTLPFDFYDTKIVDAPGMYEFDMELAIDSDGNMKLVPIDLKFIKPLVVAKPKE